jgi:PE family
MSFVIAAPDLVIAAASDLASIGSAINAANAAAVATTTSVVAAAADEVSTQLAALFGAHARSYQALSAQAAAFHDQFVRALNAGAGTYAGTEAANASPLQTLEQDVLGVINAPTEALLGRPLIGDGANSTTVGCCSATAAAASTAPLPGCPAPTAEAPG